MDDTFYQPKVYQAIRSFKVRFQTPPVHSINERNDVSLTISEISEIDPNCASGCQPGIKEFIGYCIGDFQHQHIHDTLIRIFDTLPEAINFLIEREKDGQK